MKHEDLTHRIIIVMNVQREKQIKGWQRSKNIDCKNLTNSEWKDLSNDWRAKTFPDDTKERMTKWPN